MFFNRRIPSFMRECYYYDSLAAIAYGIFAGLSINFFPVIARRLGASSFQMGLLTAAPFIGALFTIYWHRLSDAAISQMGFFVKVKLLARAAILLTAVATNPWIFIIIVFINSLLEQAGSPAYVGIMKRVYSDGYRARAMGYVRTEMAIVAIFASYIGGFFLDHFSYRYIFPVGALFGLLSIASFGKIKVNEENKTPQRKKYGVLPREILEVLKKDKTYALFLSIFFIYGFASIIVMPLYPIFLVDYLRLSNISVGKLASISSFFLILSYLFWGNWIDREGPSRSLALSFSLGSFIPLCYFFASSIWYIVPASIISGFIMGAGEIARINFITNRAKKEDIPTYRGVDFTLMGLRGVIAPFLGVALMSWVGIRSVFIISFFMMVFSSLAMRMFNHYNS